MKLNTPTLWQQFRRRIGLPGTTRVVDIDSTTVCRMAAEWKQKEAQHAETRTRR